MYQIFCFGRSTILGDGTGCAAKLLGVNVSSRDRGATGDAPLELKTKATNEYRVQKILIKRSDAIDQVLIQYTDGTQWSCGHDGGKADNRPAVMTAGEFLVRVTHERFVNYKSAAAAIEFETNLGRVFSYHPKSLSTRWSSESSTVAADPGCELVALTIRRGVLLGATQQAVPPSARAAPGDRGDTSRPWYAVASLRPKEDDDAPNDDGAFVSVRVDGDGDGDDGDVEMSLLGGGNNNGKSDANGDGGNAGDDDDGDDGSVRYRHFHDKARAQAAWARARAAVRAKAGRAALLVDCRGLKVLREAGDKAGVAEATKKCREAGFTAAKKDEDVSMLDAVLMLGRVLSNKRDAYTMAGVMALLGISFYLDLCGKVLTGHVLTLAGGGADAAILTKNWAARAACEYLVGGCDAASPSVDGLRNALLAAFVAVRLVDRLANAANVYVHHRACDSKNHRLRVKAFDHVLGLDQAYFDTHSTSEIRGSMNVHTLNNLITWNVPYLVTLTFKMVMLAYFMLSINATLGGVSIAAYCVIKFGVLDPINAYEKVTHKVQRKLNIMNHQIMDEAFNMATSVKLFSKEAHHMHEHETSQLRYAANINAVVVLRCLREFSYGVLRVCIVGAVLYLGLSTFVASDMGAGDLTAFFLLLENFQHVFHRIKWHYEVLVREFPDIDRFLTLMQQKATVHSGDQKPANVRGEIVFRNVVFEYPSRPGEKALDGLDLTIRANKMTAIVGDSGAGKSTIAKLVMRLYDPTSGSITLDGTDVRELDLCYLHDQIAIVNQNPELFNASLAENIGYGATGDWTMADVERAAKLAHCHDFVAKFRGGYDTFAGCRGAQLSGGQKQRIAIARAAIRNSRVLILDEATSSLDAESEELVQAALENIMAGRTILVIAHRLSTIKNADEVLCMRGGEVVERGTHDELIARDGHYAQLVRKQLVEERYQQELKSELKSSSKKNGGGGNETSDESTTYTATTASPAHRGAPGFWTDDEEEDNGGDGGEKKESPEKDATARAAAVVWERRPDRHRPRERRWAGRRARARFADSGFPRVRLRRYATS